MRTDDDTDREEGDDGASHFDGGAVRLKLTRQICDQDLVQPRKHRASLVSHPAAVRRTSFMTVTHIARMCIRRSVSFAFEARRWRRNT